MGLNPKTKYTRITMHSKAKNPDPKEGENTIVNQCSYSKEARTIIADSNWADHDYTPREAEAGRLPQSELTFQRWKEIAGNDVADLKYIIRQKIVNKGSMNTIQSVFKEMRMNPKEKGEFVPSTPGSDMDIAYRKLAGLDNGRPNYRFYSQHHQELRDIEVVKIHVWTGLSFESSCAMVFEFGRSHV